MMTGSTWWRLDGKSEVAFPWQLIACTVEMGDSGLTFQRLLIATLQDSRKLISYTAQSLSNMHVSILACRDGVEVSRVA